MKNILLILLVAACVSLGVICFKQRQEIKQTTLDLNATRDQLAQSTQATEEIARAEKKTKFLQSALTENTVAASEKTRQIADLQKSLAATKTSSTNSGLEGLGAMFKDPKMREMIKAQQKNFMAPMIAKQYTALYQQLNLSDDQRATMKELLVKKMTANADQGMSIMDTSLDATQRAEIVKQGKFQQDDLNNQIKQLIGEDKYPEFQTYEKSLPNRIVVNSFNDQLETANALTPDQQQQMIQALSEAHTNFKFTTDFAEQKNSGTDPTTAFTQEKLDTYAREKELFDQQFLTQAKSILTPDQLKNFEDFQTSQRTMQMAGMKMAAQMFAPKEK